MQSKIPQIEVDFSRPCVKLYPSTVLRFQSIVLQSILTLCFGSTSSSSQQKIAATCGDLSRYAIPIV